MPPPPPKKKKKKRSREYVFLSLSTLPFPPFFEGEVSDDYFPNTDDSVIKGPCIGAPFEVGEFPSSFPGFFPLTLC